MRITAPDPEKSKTSGPSGPFAQVEVVPLLPESWNLQSKLAVEVKAGRNVFRFSGKKGEEPKAETGP